MESKQSSAFPAPTNVWFDRTPIPIVDKEGRVIALLAGRPADENWDEVQEAAAALLEKIRSDCPEFDDGCHRRGDFPTLRCGVSHGGGRLQPMNFTNGLKKQRALDELNSHPSFVRIAGLMNCMLMSFAQRAWLTPSQRSSQHGPRNFMNTTSKPSLPFSRTTTPCAALSLEASSLPPPTI